MDLGDMTSRDLGKLTSAGLAEKGKEVLKEQQGLAPEALKNQNTEHNAKKSR